MQPEQGNERLLDGQQLLQEVFASPPSSSWLRDQRRARKIPYVKLGRKIFYDPAEVRRALKGNFTVKTINES